MTAQPPSPCKIPGLWDFRGQCFEFGMQAQGLGMGVGPVQGYRLQIQFPKNNAKSGDMVIVGDGTSDLNITGKVQGQKFPLYGSVPCISATGTSTTCAGKGVLYVEILNTSADAIKFASLPTVTLQGPKKLGTYKQCQIDALKTSSGKPAWFQLPVTAAPSGTQLTFPAYNVAVTLPATSGLFAAVSCQ